MRELVEKPPIDLSKLPPPDIIEEVAEEKILEGYLARFREMMPGVEIRESDPAFRVMAACAYREYYLRKRFNDTFRQSLFAFSEGTNLDNMVPLFQTSRRIIEDENGKVVRRESDDELRSRAHLAFDGPSTAGSRSGYRHHARGAHKLVKDISVVSPEPCCIQVAVLGFAGNGYPSDEVWGAVVAALHDEAVRPAGDRVEVLRAEIVEYEVAARLVVPQGPDPRLLLREARRKLDVSTENLHRLGRPVAKSALYGALHRDEVLRVELTLRLRSGQDVTGDHIPVSPWQAGYCYKSTIEVLLPDGSRIGEGRDG